MVKERLINASASPFRPDLTPAVIDLSQQSDKRRQSLGLDVMFFGSLLSAVKACSFSLFEEFDLILEPVEKDEFCGYSASIFNYICESLTDITSWACSM